MPPKLDHPTIPQWEESEQLIVDLVRNFATREVAPRAAAIDETGEFPTDLVRRMGELGLMGLPIPEAYDGGGQSHVVFALAVEELCRACAITEGA